MLNYGNMQPYQAQNIPNYYYSQNAQIRPIMQNPVNIQNPMNLQNPVIVQNPVNMRIPVNMQNPINYQNPMNLQNPVIVQNPVNIQKPVNMQNPVNTQKNQNTQNMQIIPNNLSKNIYPGYNTKSAQNTSNIQKIQNTQMNYNIQNTKTSQNIPKLQKLQNIPTIQNTPNIVSQWCLGCNKAVPIEIILEAFKSACKIIISVNQNNIYGTGFFMKLLENQRCLITNNHVISQDNIYNDVEIEIYNQKKMKLNLKNRKIKYFPKPKDITVIEIKPSDNIYNDVLFLDFDLNSNGEKAKYGCGKIVKVNDFEFDHDIETESGASGSPIILCNSNINSIQVIGIHKEANYIKNLNSGTFIGEIFKKENNNVPKNNNNYIIAEIDIKDDEKLILKMMILIKI